MTQSMVGNLIFYETIIKLKMILLKKWPESNMMQVIPLGNKNQMCKYRMGDTWLGNNILQ